MTLTYAAKAALIRNRPVKNDDPQTKLIEELKGQVKTLTMELIRANQYIEQVCAVSGQPSRKFGAGLLPASGLGADTSDQSRQSLTVAKNKSVAQMRSVGNRLTNPSPYSSTSKVGGNELSGADQEYLQT